MDGRITFRHTETVGRLVDEYGRSLIDDHIEILPYPIDNASDPVRYD